MERKKNVLKRAKSIKKSREISIGNNEISLMWQNETVGFGVGSVLETTLRKEREGTQVLDYIFFNSFITIHRKELRSTKGFDI